MNTSANSGFVICKKQDPKWVLLTDGALMTESALRAKNGWGWHAQLFDSRRAARSAMAKQGKHPALYTVRPFGAQQ
jgi:hypothetical protein